MQKRLDELHLTAAQAARYFGVVTRTMYGWRHAACPAHIIKCLDYLIECKRALDDLYRK